MNGSYTMNILAFILAQTRFNQRLKGLENAFKQANTAGPDWETILALTVVFAGVVGLLLMTRRIQRRQAGELFAKKPYKLFAYALKKLGVGFSDRLFARLAARKCGLRQPTVMLFSPELMEHTLGRWAESRPLGFLRHRARARLAVITAKAFPQEVGPAAT